MSNVVKRTQEALPSGRILITEVTEDGKKEHILTSKDGQKVAAVLDNPDISRMYGIIYPERKTSDYYKAHPELNPCSPVNVTMDFNEQPVTEVAQINSATASH